MEIACTCGALPPADARFCHKCGRPLYEADRVRLEEDERSEAARLQAASLAESAAQNTPAAITFRNSRAVLITMLVAGFATVTMPLVTILAVPLVPIFLCAVGFVAVVLYRGRSAQKLTPGACARLGWMTGLWIFLVAALLMGASALYIASPEGWEQARNTWKHFPQGESLLRISQQEMLREILSKIPLIFFLLTLLPGLGGVLGARFPLRRPSA